MHSYIVRFLYEKKILEETVTTYSPEDASSIIKSRYKNCLIISLKCIDYDNDDRIY